MHPHIALQRRQGAHEGKAEHDGQRTEEPSEQLLLLTQQHTEPAEEQSEGHEHRTEPEDEECATGQQAATAGGVQVGAHESSDVGQVTGDEGEHTRGQEGHQPGQQRQRRGQQQRSIEHGGPEDLSG
jgi:hypothetical protein